MLETKKLLEMYLYKLNYPIIYSGSVTNHNYALGSPKMYEIMLFKKNILCVLVLNGLEFSKNQKL